MMSVPEFILLSFFYKSSYVIFYVQVLRLIHKYRKVSKIVLILDFLSMKVIQVVFRLFPLSVVKMFGNLFLHWLH